MDNNFYNSSALRVEQPIGEFYITRIPASVLLQVTYSDPLRVKSRSNTGYTLAGNQRLEAQRRLTEIQRYIETAEATFPNSIILAANYDKDDNLIDDDKIRWRIEDRGDDCCKLIIPSSEKAATIVDGQHRLHAFEGASEQSKNMDLVCTVFLDLPNPFQAFIFATINFNQKRVDKSLAYEMFGFDLDTEPPMAWSPDKTAVFLARKLNTDPDSPLQNHIALAPRDTNRIISGDQQGKWQVSMATMVDGILKLISTNPRRDKDTMNIVTVAEGRARKMLPNDTAPLRSYFLDSNDLVVYTILLNYFKAVADTLWNVPSGTFLQKSVGVQALLDILQRILHERLASDRDISINYYSNWLAKAKNLNFTNLFESSGVGRVKIRSALLAEMGFTN